MTLLDSPMRVAHSGAMARYILDIDLVGSTVTETIEAPDDESASVLAVVMYPEARSITVSGVVFADVPAQS